MYWRHAAFKCQVRLLGLCRVVLPSPSHPFPRGRSLYSKEPGFPSDQTNIEICTVVRVKTTVMLMFGTFAQEVRRRCPIEPGVNLDNTRVNTKSPCAPSFEASTIRACPNCKNISGVRDGEVCLRKDHTNPKLGWISVMLR
jgi:hypothetical protein